MRGWEPVPLDARFFDKVAFVDDASSCWLWTGCTTDGGYGRLVVGSRSDGTRKSERATRVALELYLGRPLREGMNACHTCDNPLCVRFSHLYEGTDSDNMRDSVVRGRFNRPRGRMHWTRRCRSSPLQRRKEKGLI